MPMYLEFFLYLKKQFYTDQKVLPLLSFRFIPSHEFILGMLD